MLPQIPVNMQTAHSAPKYPLNFLEITALFATKVLMLCNADGTVRLYLKPMLIQVPAIK